MVIFSANLDQIEAASVVAENTTPAHGLHAVAESTASGWHEKCGVTAQNEDAARHQHRDETEEKGRWSNHRREELPLLVANKDHLL